MTDFKVKRPKITIAAGALATVTAALGVLWLSLGLMTILGNERLELSERQMFFGSTFLIVVIVCLVMVFIGGILIWRRRYRSGGILALVFSIFLVTSAGIWYVAIWGIAGGILGIIAREKVPERVLELVRQRKQVNIKELAAETGKTELDVEQAIVKLQSKGQPIRLDMKSREVILDT